MPRSFNTSGPRHPGRDYMLPAVARLPEVRGLIERGKYFVIHAPRKTSKTTAVATLARELTEEGHYVAAQVSMEVGSAIRDLGAVWRDGRMDPQQEGLEQLYRHLAGLGLSSGWLIVFDQRSMQPPIAERTRVEAQTSTGGGKIEVVRS